MEQRDETGTIAKRFASVRSRSGLSRKDFAASLGIHPVVAGDIELGKRDPSREVLVKLVQAWGVDVSWLLTGIPAGSAAGGVRAGTEFSAGAGSGGSMVEIKFVDQAAAAGRAERRQDVAKTSWWPPLSVAAGFREDRGRRPAVRARMPWGPGPGASRSLGYHPGRCGRGTTRS